MIRGAEAHGRGFVSGHAATLAALADGRLAVAGPARADRRRARWSSSCAWPGCTSARTCRSTSSAAPALGIAVGGGVRLLMGRPR